MYVYDVCVCICFADPFHVLTAHQLPILSTHHPHIYIVFVYITQYIYHMYISI